MAIRVTRSAAPRSGLRAAGLALALAAGAACGGSSTEPDAVDAYMKDLPSWEEFSPVLPDVDPHAAGTPGPAETRLVGDKEFSCQTWPYAVQRTPRELVMYSPNVEILWPGSLIQGRSHRDGAGLDALLALTIAERTPIKVSIPALKTADNFREVVPDQATVSAAIGAMIGAATEDDLRTPSTIAYEMEAFHSEEQLALQLGVSGRYLGFSAKASFSYDQSAEETTVVMHFMEKMFEVVVAPPQTPRAFFSADFTHAKLDEQIQLGRIGPDNLPLYVSNVVYGRMFTFAMTSTKSEQEIRAALQAAYSFGVGEVSTELTAEQRSLIQSSRIAIASVGGDAQATLDVIKTGDWRAYFATTSSLASATPLSYTFRSLADGTIGLVTEATTYDLTVCDPVLVPGFLEVQPVRPMVAPPFSVASGDLNGDGRMDLVWNHLSTKNEVRVGFGKANGTFDLVTAPVVAIAGSPAGAWTAFTLLVADMDGDGRDDLAWNRVASGTSETRVARSLGDGTFEVLPAHLRDEAEWATPAFAVAAARARAKPGMPPARDLLWTRLTGEDATAVASVWGGGAPVDLPPQVLAAPTGGWSPSLGANAGDLTGDGVDDLVFGMRGGVCAAVNDGAGSFVEMPAYEAAMPCFGSYVTCPVASILRVGDVNGDGLADVLRYDRSFCTGEPAPPPLPPWCMALSGSQVLTSNGAGGFLPGVLQTWNEHYSMIELWGYPHLVDVSGDGKADLVWITLSPEARVRAAEAKTSQAGAFMGFQAVPDHQPATALPPGADDWSDFRPLFGDVNGDGVVDVVLSDAKAVGSVYVDIR